MNVVLTGAALAGAGAAALAHGTFHRNSWVLGASLGALPTRSRALALTFDDGPNPETTPRVLDALARADVRATFFVLGKHAERWPDLVRRVAEEGHQIGNHGYHHRRLHLRGPRYTHEDLQLGTDRIAVACGVTPRFFRAPHGFRNLWVASVARSLEQRIVGWSLGVWDSDRPGAEVIAQRSISGVRPGTILLLHDGDGYDPAGDRRQTADAVPAIVNGLRDRGYRFELLPRE